MMKLKAKRTLIEKSIKKRTRTKIKKTKHTKNYNRMTK